jgi:diketogulonate reductase-like aldo/keto reductase
MSTTITLNDSNTVPWIAYGTGTALFAKDVANYVKTAIASGFIHLDGAQVYANEESLGAGIAASGKSRSELYVTTKLGKLAEGESVEASLKGSLQKLGLDYVDLFLIHWPTPHEGRLQEVWKEMEKVKKDGLAKSIGVSNFKVNHLKQILDGATIKPAVNQIEYHPYLYKATEPIVDFCQEHNIVIASFGGLTPIVRTKGPLDTILPTIRGRLEKTRGEPVTEGQVLLKWLQAKNILIVTTSTKEERIKEYLDTVNVPPLTPEEIQIIDDTGSKFHNRFFGTFWGPEE